MECKEYSNKNPFVKELIKDITLGTTSQWLTRIEKTKEICKKINLLIKDIESITVKLPENIPPWIILQDTKALIEHLKKKRA